MNLQARKYDREYKNQSNQFRREHMALTRDILLDSILYKRHDGLRRERKKMHRKQYEKWQVRKETIK